MKKLISTLLILAMVITLLPAGAFAQENTAFSDIDGTEYYSQAATALQESDILEGYPDGSFGAEKPITRAEMTAVVCRMIGKEEEAETSKGKTIFNDVSSDHWATGYINVATKEGIINGDGNGKFRPQDDVKYEEAVKMVVCAFGYDKDVVSDPQDWSKGYLKIAEEKEITSGLMGEKGKAITRGDIAVVSYNGIESAVKDGIIERKTKTEDNTKVSKEDNKKEEPKAEVKKSSGGGGGGGSSTPAATYYTVSFNLNYEGATGAPASQSVVNGGKATQPEKPQRDGYKFENWYINAECTSVFNFDTVINSNKVLYAKWVESNTLVELKSSKENFFVKNSVSSEDVYFYAELKEIDDAPLYVKLYDDQNNMVSQLYDDGKYSVNGDEFSNDNIYTCKISLNVANIAQYQYHAVAEYDNPLVSNTVNISVIAAMTEQQIEQMSTADTQIQNGIFEVANFNTMTSEEKKELTENVLEDLTEQGMLIEDTVTYDEESETFTFLYESGAIGAVILKEWDESENGVVSNSVRGEQNTKNEIPLQKSNYLKNNTQTIYQTGGGSAGGSSSGTVASTELNNNNADGATDAIILWSFNQYWDIESYRKPFYNIVKTSWDSMGANTLIDYDVTVDDYKHLTGYEIIVFSGHGIYAQYSLPNSEEKQTMSSLLLSEKSTSEKDALYAEDLSLQNIGRFQLPSYGTIYAILPNFWTNYYSGEGLGGSFIFAENCEFYGKSNVNYQIMADTLTGGASAESVVGFHNSVLADYSRGFMKYYIEKLLEGKTTGSAFDDAKNMYGINDGQYLNPATPTINVKNGNYNAVLVSGGLKNPEFEDGNTPLKWGKTGDVRVISKLGELTPTKNEKMAILTTGIGSGTSSYLGATEGSTLYQTFTVPNDATSINFDYNVVSEEPWEYVGSQYDDKFIAQIEVVQDNSNVNIVYETVNTSVWSDKENPITTINFDGGDETTYQTGWKTATYDLTGLRGKLITLRFIVYDVGDSIYDTAALIDNIVIQSGDSSSSSTPQPIYYTVQFDLNYEEATGAPASQNVVKSSNAVEPQPPKREGFVFAGWYSDMECTQKFDFAQAVDMSYTLYARWLNINSDENTKFAVVAGAYGLFMDGNNEEFYTLPVYYNGAINDEAQTIYFPYDLYYHAAFQGLVKGDIIVFETDSKGYVEYFCKISDWEAAGGIETYSMGLLNSGIVDLTAFTTHSGTDAWSTDWANVNNKNITVVYGPIIGRTSNSITLGKVCSNTVGSNTYNQSTDTNDESQCLNIVLTGDTNAYIYDYALSLKNRLSAISASSIPFTPFSSTFVDNNVIIWDSYVYDGMPVNINRELTNFAFVTVSEGVALDVLVLAAK